MNRPHLLAVELELDDLVIGVARGIDVFHAVLLAQFQTVNARRADGAQEFAGRRKDHDAALGVGADLVDTKALREGREESITDRARQFLEVVREARGS